MDSERRIERLLETALDLRGIRYRDGGASRSDGFDCSGFTQYVFSRQDLPLPRQVRDQFQTGRAVASAAVRPGDLLFFSTTGPGATHVGIALDEDQFIHAPSGPGAVRVERRSAAYWAARFVGARRIGPD